MRREVAAMLLAFVVITAAVAFVYVAQSRGGGERTTTQSATTTPLPSNCTTTFPSGLDLRGPGNQTRLFTLLPGTTGLICLSYKVDPGEISGADETVQFSSSVESVKATYENNSNGAGYVYSYSYEDAQGVTGSAHPSSVTFARGSGNTTITVVYAITASVNSTGYYSIGFTACSPLIPFAITRDWTGVVASDFDGFFVASSCTGQPPISDAQVVGIASVNTTLLSG